LTYGRAKKIAGTTKKEKGKKDSGHKGLIRRKETKVPKTEWQKTNERQIGYGKPKEEKVKEKRGTVGIAATRQKTRKASGGRELLVRISYKKAVGDVS